MTTICAPAIATDEQTRILLAANGPVAVGVSGGKDSQAAALRVAAHLHEIGHTGPRLLIHSDLGRIEWKASLPTCRKLAEHLGWELVVVERSAGDLLARWETRWANNVDRYASLSCVKLILPWSTPQMRFCTSELKTAIICRYLANRFPGQTILSVTGIRRQESDSRAKMPVLAPQPKLQTKGCSGFNWNPIIEWSLDETLSYIQANGVELHEAYTKYNLSRVSCAYCIMSSQADLMASAACAENHDIYRQLVDLEVRSTFAFQGNGWLGDIAPHLLDDRARTDLSDAKKRAQLREFAESRIPKHLLYVKGWPTCVPTQTEAELLAGVRHSVAATVGIDVGFTAASSIRARYEELLQAKPGRTQELPLPTPDEPFQPYLLL